MGKLGWSYPAGCDGPPDYEGQCEICGLEAGQCMCPVCPVCEAQGDPKCYREHGLQREMTDAEKVRILRATIQKFLDAYAGEKRLRLGNGIAGQWYGEAEKVMEATRPRNDGHPNTER